MPSPFCVPDQFMKKPCDTCIVAATAITPAMPTAATRVKKPEIRASDGAVTLVPSYIRDLAAAAVRMIPVADAEARWDFLAVWQRGRTAKPLQTLLEALSTTMTAACAKQRGKGR
jgi:hypothetical protein